MMLIGFIRAGWRFVSSIERMSVAGGQAQGWPAVMDVVTRMVAGHYGLSATILSIRHLTSVKMVPLADVHIA